MDPGAEEEQHHNPFLDCHVPKLQYRSEISKARWDEHSGMSEIIEKKGGIWTSTGLTRDGKLFCTIEEIVFYMEKGALHLLDSSENVLDLKYMYKKLAEGRHGCNMESFEVYRHLKSLGYIIRRHDVPWTMKREKGCCPETSSVLMIEKLGVSDNMEEEAVIMDLAKRISIDGLELNFDVYLPNSQFRKTSPGDPNFILSLLSGKPPSIEEVEDLEEKCKGVPLKLCHVDNGRVSIVSFEKLTLDVLP